MDPSEATVAVSVRGAEVAPCLPGVDLLVVAPKAEVSEAVRIDTSQWAAQLWARRLYELDVNVLICAGIDRFAHGMMAGYGIEVIPGRWGTLTEALVRYRTAAIGADATTSSCPVMQQDGFGSGRQGRHGRGGGRYRGGMGGPGGGPGRGRGRRYSGPPWGEDPAPWSGGPR